MTNTSSPQELDALWVRYAGEVPRTFDELNIELRAVQLPAGA
jgi:hypothetical protein